MTEVLLLGRRAVREVIRLPEATIPTLFIPLFFLAVNIGQVSKTFPSTTPFLHGQGYVGFQLPVSLMFAVCTATSGLALVTEIDLGYFDKLLVAPIRRSSIIFGRLAADLVRGIGVSTLVLLVALAFGATMRSGVTPNFVPFDRLSPVMEALARANPVSYVIEGLRSLVLQGWVPGKLAICVAVIVATGLGLTWLSVRAIERYDR
ncbi:MAG: ABC transporter permease [Actinobacteria bacterium]|nr:MAG: ABC transporter permease [Actinomycetota bacterium]